MSYFRKSTNEAGEEVYVEVDLAVEELPEAVVKAQKPFKDVLSESIERRKELAAIKAQRSEEVSGGSETVSTTAGAAKKPEVPVQTPVVDPDALYADFKARLQREQDEVNKQKQEEQNSVKSLIKEFGLRGEDVVDILVLSKDPRAAAEKLARSKRFDEQSSGDPAQQQVEGAIAGAFKRLGLEDKPQK